MKPDPLSNRVYNFSRGFIPPGSTILVAVSGGSDSVALLLILLDLKRLLKLGGIGVAHLNHGLRGKQSDADEKFVTRLAASCGVPVFTRKTSGKSLDDPGVEAWARDERYGFFQSVMKDHGYRLLATGHTADDQAETVLMRMLRGAGLKGMRGIACNREDGVVRPLLCVRKQELEQWLRNRGRRWRTDPTNTDVRMKRNWVRHRLLPLIEANEKGAVEGLADYAAQSRRQWELVLPRIRQWRKRHVCDAGATGFTLAKAGLRQSAIASEGIAETMRSAGISVTGYHISQVLSCKDRQSGILLLPDRWKVIISGKSLKFLPHA